MATTKATVSILRLPCMALMLLGVAIASQAATVCTHTDYPGAGKSDVRSLREVTTLHIQKQIALGEQAQGKGQLSAAYDHYRRALEGFMHPDLGAGVGQRCGRASDYQRAVSKLQSVAVQLADAALAEGNYLGSAAQRRALMQGSSEENQDRVKLMQGWGALDFYIGAWLYDDFQRQLEPFLDSQFARDTAPQRFTELLQLIRGNAARLQGDKERYEAAYDWQKLERDTSGLLPQEAAGLSALELSRKTVVAAIEPNIDYWLEQEQQAFRQLETTTALIAESMAAKVAIDKLKIAAKLADTIAQAGSYKEQPWYSLAAQRRQLIMAQAEQHGDQLMAQQRPQPARSYFAFAGQRDKSEQADTLAREQGDAMAEQAKERWKDGGGVYNAASDEEREQFQSDADALADELGL